jgi:autotransporter-associated beta strand protein
MTVSAQELPKDQVIGFRDAKIAFGDGSLSLNATTGNVAINSMSVTGAGNVAIVAQPMAGVSTTGLVFGNGGSINDGLIDQDGTFQLNGTNYTLVYAINGPGLSATNDAFPGVGQRHGSDGQSAEQSLSRGSPKRGRRGNLRAPHRGAFIAKWDGPGVLAMTAHVRPASIRPVSASRRVAALLSSVAPLARSDGGMAAAVALATILALVAPPALADGGAGGAGQSTAGGAGGTDSATGTGGTGGSVVSGIGGGGGGGGAGATGGSGGSGVSGGGGAGGQSAGAAGAAGDVGGGGGGGAHGFVGSALPIAAVIGGNGGSGGAGQSINAGGGGGAGGYGAVITSTGGLGTLGAAVTGGVGGNGGLSQPFNGGDGGTGGIGLLLSNPLGATVTIDAAVSGGQGGLGGIGIGHRLNSAGLVGVGGVGIVGENLNVTVTGSGSVAGGLSGDGATRANAITFTGGTNVLTLQSNASFTGNVVAFSAADTLQLGGSADASFNVAQIGAAAQFQGFGAFQKVGSSTWTLSGTTTAVTPWAINAGTLAVSADANLGNSAGGLAFGGGTLQYLSGFTTSRAVTLNAGGGAIDTNGNAATLAGTIGGSGGLTKTGTGTLTLSGVNSYQGGTTVNAGTLALAGAGTLGASTGATAVNGSTAVLDLGGTSQTQNGGVSLLGNGTIQNGTLSSSGMFDMRAGVVNANLAGTGAVVKSTSGIVTFVAANSYQGGTAINAGTLAVSADANLGNSVGGLAFGGGTLQYLSGFTTSRAVTLNAGGGAIDTNGNAATLAGAMGGTGGLTKIGTGTLTLAGNDAYTGATTVAAGTLIVSGSAASSAVTVQSGATLAGTGIVGSTVIGSGATFAPGPQLGPGGMAISGNLVIQSGALYLLQVNATTASAANVSGIAALAGNVQASFASGSYLANKYTILSATTRSGVFAGLSTVNLPAGFTASLSYTSTEADLNLVAALGGGSGGGGPSALGTGGLSGNQRNVANALNNFFNSGGALPPAFVNVFGLTGTNAANGLSQLSGEASTGAQQSAFLLMSSFLGTMLDPFMGGRADIGGAPALGYDAEQPDQTAGAFASVKSPVSPAKPSFEQRWTAWSGAFGGLSTLPGDATVGSHDLTARGAGVVAGLDYHVTRDTLLGFALAGAGADWSVAQALGTGKSDAFQAGVYTATRWGAAYLGTAVAVANHWMSTDRFAPFGDHLTAKFDGMSLGARAEAGYRFATPYAGITPFAAFQGQDFRTPAYTETDLSGGGFALSYNARNATDLRGEVGTRLDETMALGTDALLTLHTKLAWAYDWISDPSLAPVFQALPGAIFVVNGAAPPKDSALATAGFELRLASGITVGGKFDGEFASRAQTYAGTGTVRVSW